MFDMFDQTSAFEVCSEETFDCKEERSKLVPKPSYMFDMFDQTSEFEVWSEETFDCVPEANVCKADTFERSLA
jgi:hypothetical protein